MLGHWGESKTIGILLLIAALHSSVVVKGAVERDELGETGDSNSYSTPVPRRTWVGFCGNVTGWLFLGTMAVSAGLGLPILIQGGMSYLLGPTDGGFSAVEQKQESARVKGLADGSWHTPDPNSSFEGQTFPEEILILPEYHHGCAVCDGLRDDARREHLLGEVPFHYEGGDNVMSRTLEEYNVAILGAQVSAYGEANAKGIRQHNPEHFLATVSGLEGLGVLDKLPSQTLSPKQKEWVAYLKKYRNSNDLEGKVPAPRDYFPTEIGNHFEEYRNFTRHIASVALTELQTTRSLLYRPPSLDADLKLTQSDQRMSQEAAARMESTYLMDLREPYMVRGAISALNEADAPRQNKVTIGIGAAHTPGVYWGLRRELDKQGYEHIRIKIHPHITSHGGATGKYNQEIIDAEAEHLKKYEEKKAKEKEKAPANNPRLWWSEFL